MPASRRQVVLEDVEIKREPIDISPKVLAGTAAAALFGVVYSIATGDFQLEVFIGAFLNALFGYLKTEFLSEVEINYDVTPKTERSPR